MHPARQSPGTPATRCCALALIEFLLVPLMVRPAAGQAPTPETFQWTITPSGVAPVGPGNVDVRVEKVLDANGPFTAAALKLSWDADDTVHQSMPGHLYVAMQGGFGHTVPGTYKLFFSADYSNLTDPPNNVRVDLTNSVTLVAVTNVTASTNHLAYGTNLITLTAEMTAEGGGEFVSWETTQESPGGQFTTIQGLTTGFLPTAGGGVYTIRATCGTSSATIELHVYELTEVTASPNPAAAGEPVTLTATTQPANCPLPLSWSVGSGTGSQITNSFGAPGYHTVTAILGASSNSCVVTNVGVDRIEYRDADLNDAWLEPPSPLYTLMATSVPFRAYPTPQGANWPAGWPKWSVDGADQATGDAYTLPGGAPANSVTNTINVKARCGTSSKEASVLFFKSEIVSGPAIYWPGRSMSEWGVGETVLITNKLSPSDLSASALNLSWETNFPAPAGFTPTFPVAIFDDAVIPGTYEVIIYRGKNYLGNTFYVELNRKGEPVFPPTTVTYLAIVPVPLTTNSFVDAGTTNVTGSGVWHEVNTSSAGIMMAVFVGPTNKDFSKLKFTEGVAPYTATGVLAHHNGVLHQRSIEHATSTRHGPGWFVGTDRARLNSDATGLAVGVTPAAAGFPDGGTRYIDIPFEWRLPTARAGLHQIWWKIVDIPSGRVVEGNGDVSGFKQNVSFSAGFTNASSPYPSGSLLLPP